MFGGFYKHNIATILPPAHIIFTLMGYKRNREKETLTLSGPVDPDKLSRASLDCLVASLECRIMTEIAESLKGVPWSWQEIYQVRKENICNVRMAVEIIRSRKSGPHLPVPQSFGQHFIVNDNSMNRVHKKASTRTTNENLINFSMDDGVPDNLIMHQVQNRLLSQKNNSSALAKESPALVPIKSSVPTSSQKTLDRVIAEDRHSQEHITPKKSVANINNVMIPSHSLSNQSAKPFEDRSVRPKIRKLPEKVEELFNNRTSASRAADLSWDYVYQVLEKKGYSKDLGERGDILDNKTKTLPSNKDRAAKTLSMPNKHLDTALKPSKDDDALWKADMFNSLQIPKTKDERTHSPSKLQNREVHSAEIIQYEKPTVKTVMAGTSPKLVKKEMSSSKKKSSPLPAKKKIEIVIDNEKKENTNVLSSDTWWSCSFCTFLNKGNTDVCEMCSRSKERGPEVQPLVSGGRECPTCTLVNERDAEHCSACQCSLKDSPTYI